MRQVYLVDNVGLTFMFGYKSGCLISNLSGLGVTRENEYLRYESTYKLVSSSNPIHQISGTLTFLKGYDGFTEFLNFLKKCVHPIRLFYRADGLKYSYVEFVSISKAELNHGSIQSEIIIDRLSMWHSKRSYMINVDENKTNKIYSYEYPYGYSMPFSGFIHVVNNGCTRSSIRLEIVGKVINPVIEIRKDDIAISKLRLLITTTRTDDLIIIDSNVSEQIMTLESNGIKTSIYQYQDFNCDNFLFLDIGNFKINFYPGVSEYTTCRFSYTENYEGN